MLIIHEIEEYSSWKAVFDNAAGIRKEPGEIAYQLLHYDRDANTIVHLLEWPPWDNARRFLESPELSRSWGTAGVKSPRFFYFQEIERGPL